MIRHLILAALLLILSHPSYAQQNPGPVAFKSRVWSFEMALLRYTERGYAGHSVDGIGGKFSIGYGTVRPTYFLLGNFDVYLGPFGIAFRTVQLDYQATGFSVVSGSSLHTLSLRGEKLGFGVLGGLGYQEFSGKSYARNDVNSPVSPTPLGIVTAYSSKIVVVDASFGLFLSYVKASRLDAHDVEDLITRNEGIIFSLQGSLPVASRFRSSFDILNQAGETQGVNQNGSLAGFRMILSLRTFLGT